MLNRGILRKPKLLVNVTYPSTYKGVTSLRSRKNN